MAGHVAERLKQIVGETSLFDPQAAHAQEHDANRKPAIDAGETPTASRAAEIAQPREGTDRAHHPATPRRGTALEAFIEPVLRTSRTAVSSACSARSLPGSDSADPAPRIVSMMVRSCQLRVCGRLMLLEVFATKLANLLLPTCTSLLQKQSSRNRAHTRAAGCPPTRTGCLWGRGVRQVGERMVAVHDRSDQTAAAARLGGLLLMMTWFVRRVICC